MLDETRMKTEAFSLTDADSDTITQVAAESHKYNRSAALRSIIAEFRDRWQNAYQNEEPTDARHD